MWGPQGFCSKMLSPQEQVCRHSSFWPHPSHPLFLPPRWLHQCFSCAGKVVRCRYAVNLSHLLDLFEISLIKDPYIPQECFNLICSHFIPLVFFFESIFLFLTSIDNVLNNYDTSDILDYHHLFHSWSQLEKASQWSWHRHQPLPPSWTSGQWCGSSKWSLLCASTLMLRWMSFHLPPPPHRHHYYQYKITCNNFLLLLLLEEKTNLKKQHTNLFLTLKGQPNDKAIIYTYIFFFSL